MSATIATFIRFALTLVPVLVSCPVSSKNHERVEISALEGELRLPAYYFRPLSDDRHPAIVFLHGCSGIGTGGGLSSTYSSWAQHLNKQGFAVLVVDSLTPRGLVTACGNTPGRRIAYKERPKDAYAALRYLQSRPEIIGDKVGLMGWSQGGGIALLSINSKSVGRPSPPPASEFRAAIALYPAACSERLQSEPYTSVPRGTWFTTTPLLVLHGGKDNWTRPEPCQAFIESIGARGVPAQFHLYPDAAHSFDAPNMPVRRRSAPRLADGSFPLLGTHEPSRQDAFRRATEHFRRWLR